MNTISKVESLLFVAGKPLTTTYIAKIINVEKQEVFDIIPELEKKYSGETGIYLIQNNNELQFVSNPASAGFTAEFIKEEASGPLTRPQLETLTIIAYCGPISKFDVEEIRGVNCSLILRNLLMRGLVNEDADDAKKTYVYTVTNEFLQNLGIEKLEALPDYDKLRNHESVMSLLNRKLENEKQ